MKCMIHWQSSVSSIVTIKPMARLNSIVLIVTMNMLMCVFAYQFVGREELYTDQYDNIDFNILFENDTLREAYYNCFMEIAPCQTPEQVVLTGIFSEAYQTNCRRCTERQKELIRLVRDWFTRNDPGRWQLIVAKTEKDMIRRNAINSYNCLRYGVINFRIPHLYSPYFRFRY